MNGDVERFFRHLVRAIASEDAERLKRPLQVAEIYQSLVPYRRVKHELGFDSNQDYEAVLLRLLAGEGGFVSLDPPEAQKALADEAGG
ncbi:MAG: hypothetical protein GTO05_02305, partial [Gemmatimonadales bacterium]|nr:hypothetical protein [Gemmatimonadales bacterium]